MGVWLSAGLQMRRHVQSPCWICGRQVDRRDGLMGLLLGHVRFRHTAAIQWLSEHGPPYTATASLLYAHELGLVPITTPAYSPESNGLAEAFVHTFKRDYVNGAE